MFQKYYNSADKNGANSEVHYILRLIQSISEILSVPT